jgi:hypothetical protein
VAVKALEWYRDEALAVALNLNQQRTQALMASITVLSNDAGNRAITALSMLERAARSGSASNAAECSEQRLRNASEAPEPNQPEQHQPEQQAEGRS